MAVLQTGLGSHRDYEGSPEQLSGLPPAADQKISATEILGISGAVDANAAELTALIAAVTAHINDSSIHAAASTDISNAYNAWVDAQEVGATTTIAEWIKSFTSAERQTLANDITTAQSTADAGINAAATAQNTADAAATSAASAVATANAALTQVDLKPSESVAPTILNNSDGALSLPVSPYHTQPHIIDSSGTATGSLPSSGTQGQPGYFEGGDYVKYTIANPTDAGQWVPITVHGDKIAWIEGTINGDATGIYINQDDSQPDPEKRSIRLFADGAGWVTY